MERAVNALHTINACIVIYNLVVLLPGVWRHGFDWQSLALVILAVGLCIGSSALVVYGAAS
jgi:membrane protein required for beta-lactamase induction